MSFEHFSPEPNAEMEFFATKLTALTQSLENVEKYILNHDETFPGEEAQESIQKLRASIEDTKAELAKLRNKDHRLNN